MLKAIYRILTILVLGLLSAFSWSQTTILRKHFSPEKTLLYRGTTDSEYSLSKFIKSYLLQQNGDLESKALTAMKLSLAGHPYSSHFDLKNDQFKSNFKTVQELVQDSKQNHSTAEATLSAYVTKKYNRSSKDIRELRLERFDYEYEFGAEMIYFSKYQQLARRYGQNMVVVDEKFPAGLDVNAFHYARHQNAAWATSTGDWGEYVLPVQVPSSEIIGIHLQGGRHAFYKAEKGNKRVILYFNLSDYADPCLTKVDNRFHHCSTVKFTKAPKSREEIFPATMILGPEAQPDAILQLCPAETSCEQIDGIPGLNTIPELQITSLI